MTWVEWSYRSWVYLTYNVSLFGVVSAVVYPSIILAVLRYSSSDSALREVVRNKTSVVPILLTGLQGLMWIFIFNHQAGIHDYWQYFISPFIAVSMASVILAAFTFSAKYMPRTAGGLAVLLALAPMLCFAHSIDVIYRLKPHYADVNNAAAAFKKLAQIVPFRVPVMTSEEFTLQPGSGEIVSQVSYYANRPLVYTTDINEIEANRQNCAAYILRATNDPNMCQLAQKLGEKYKLAAVEGGYMIFLLNQPEKHAK
jgi:hypothetical protein